MAADTLGAQSFIWLKGEIHAPAMEVEDISRPGVDYIALRKLSLKPEPSKLVGFRDAASATAAHALRTTYAALQGTITTIVQQGRTYQNIAIKKANVKEIIPLAKSVGGIAAGTYAVFAEFEIVYAGNSWSIT